MSKLVQSQQLQLGILEAAVLEILRRPLLHPVSLKEIATELNQHYDIIEVEHCLQALSREGLVEPAYTSGYSLGFRARGLKPRW